MPRLKENSYLGLRMENEILEQIRAFARDRGMVVSAAVRQLVLDGLEVERRERDRRTRKLVGDLKKSVGEYFVLKAVGDGLALERIKPAVVDLGRARKPAKKELMHA